MTSDADDADDAGHADDREATQDSTLRDAGTAATRKAHTPGVASTVPLGGPRVSPDGRTLVLVVDDQRATFFMEPQYRVER